MGEELLVFAFTTRIERTFDRGYSYRVRIFYGDQLIGLSYHYFLYRARRMARQMIERYTAEAHENERKYHDLIEQYPELRIL
jgi:hypothetical protein